MLHVVSTTPLQYRLGYRKLGSHKFNQELSKTLSTYLPASLPTYYLQQAPHDIDDAKASNVDLNNNKQTTTAKQLGIYMCSSSVQTLSFPNTLLNVYNNIVSRLNNQAGQSTIHDL